MASQNSLWLLSALFIAFICSSHAIILEVGEDDGWTLNPVESYSAWAGRLRFRVNDTLHFKYNDATDSVLVVNKEDYDNCNVDNPIQRLDGGDNSFRLTEGGAHYFITGNKSNCEQGQKVDVEVLHIRAQSPPSPPPAPAPLPPAPASPVAGPPPSTTPLLTPPSSAPTGGSSPSPVGSTPADLNTPPPSPVPSATPSSATAVVSGTITAAIVIIAMSSII